MKRIGLISWDYDHPKGGLGRAMQELTSAMRELGYDVHVLTPRRLTGGPFLFSFTLLFVLSRWIRTHRIEIVLFPVGPGGIFLPRNIAGVRVIAISYHTYGQQSHDVPGEWWKRLFIPLEKVTLAKVDRILCYSRDTQSYLGKSYRIAAEKIRYSAQLLPQRLFQDHGIPNKEKGLCVAVMRLDARKGTGVLLRAWPMIQEKYPSAHLIIVGDGAIGREVDRFVKLFQNVRRQSKISEEDLYALVARAEIALCPAYLEGFGLAAAEAMLLGTALIASDAEGLRSLVRHGILFPPGNANALAHAVCTLLKDSAFRANLARAANQDMRQRFGIEDAKADLQRAMA